MIQECALDQAKCSPVVRERQRERENFICHSNEQEYHTVVTIQQNISTHVWQAARNGITPIELATLKKEEKKKKLN